MEFFWGFGWDLRHFTSFCLTHVTCYLGVSKNRGTPNLDGLWWKTLFLNGWFGGYKHIFGNTHLIYITTAFVRGKWHSRTQVAVVTGVGNPWLQIPERSHCQWWDHWWGWKDETESRKQFPSPQKTKTAVDTFFVQIETGSRYLMHFAWNECNDMESNWIDNIKFVAVSELILERV